ncbi:MAG: hypothetical protein L0215_10210 [Gemmataceae bacterium]|nr:hypothetical protein [Gemmataceae bacterium]
MSNPKTRKNGAVIEKLLDEASWLVSHAQALEDYGRKEADAEWLRAGECEEEVACLLEGAGRVEEAAVHRVSSASCFEKVGAFARAATLFQATLSANLLSKRLRTEVEQRLERCWSHANKSSRKNFVGRKKPTSV